MTDSFRCARASTYHDKPLEIVPFIRGKLLKSPYLNVWLASDAHSAAHGSLARDSCALHSFTHDLKESCVPSHGSSVYEHKLLLEIAWCIISETFFKHLVLTLGHILCTVSTKKVGGL
jgi:hypothetical protein